MAIPANAFTIRKQIRFGDSDPAGIVFYPQFFRMFNDLFEDWMINELGLAFAYEFLVNQRMFPLVHVDVDFKKARVMGQALDLSLILTGLGRSSIRYSIVGHDGDIECLNGDFVHCVASKTTKRAVEIPDYIRRPDGGLSRTLPKARMRSRASPSRCAKVDADK